MADSSGVIDVPNNDVLPMIQAGCGFVGGGGGGSGDVVGPASAVSGNIAIFNGATGKIIQDGGKALPAGSVVGTSDTQTLTGKTISGASNTLTVRLDQSDVTNTLPVGKGGTGASAAGGTALDNITGFGFTGIVKRTGAGAYSAAAAGTDYAAAPGGGANTPLFNNGSGGFTNGTRSGNTTTVVTKDASSPATNDCAKWDASGNLTTAGAACGAGGGSVSVTDGTNTVPAVSSVTFDPKTMVVGGSAGAATVGPTVTVGTDQSAGDYTLVAADSNTTIPIGAAHTYTVPQANSTGFENGWGTCLQNVSTSGNATITTSTSVFKGAGGASSFQLEPHGWACIASKGGDWYAQVGHFNTIPGQFYLTGTISPTIAGNQNDYNPANLATASLVRIDGGGADRTITGLAGGGDGRVITLKNNGAINNLLLSNESASSSAANRFTMTGNVTLPPGASLSLRYDGSSSRWIPWGRALHDTGVTAGSYTCTNLTVAADGRLTAAANGSCSGGSGITKAFAAIGWVAGVDPNKAVVMTASSALTVTAIRGTVADAVGSAATVQVNKAPSGTVCGSGTNQATGTFDANGTAATNQTLTLAGGAANSLSAGDRLCLVTTGGANWTGGSGNGGITVEYTVP